MIGGLRFPRVLIDQASRLGLMPSREAGAEKKSYKVYFPLEKGEVFRRGHPPRGTCPKQAGRKLARKAEEKKL